MIVLTFRDKIYITLCVLFSVLIVISNLTYQKFAFLPLLPFHTFELSVGALFYPFTYMLSDIIAEFYGKDRAGFCVKLSIAMNCAAALIIYMFINLDATHWSNVDNATFAKVFGAYTHSFIGSIIATYISQRIDISIYLYFKELTQDKLLWLRNICSTSISLFIDSVIAIGFLIVTGILPYKTMLGLITHSYSFKLLVAVSSIPLFYTIVLAGRKLCRQELHP